MRTDTVCQTVAHSKLESCKLRIHHMPIRLITDKCWIARFLPWLQLFQQQVHWRPDRLDEFFAPLHTWKLTFTIHSSDYAYNSLISHHSLILLTPGFTWKALEWGAQCGGGLEPWNPDLEESIIYMIYKGAYGRQILTKKGGWPDEDLPPPSSHSQQTDPMLLLAHVLRQFQQSPKF